ncbi:TPA: hypothetical protein PXN76_002538 [Yersinia enterocolitica]|nr:hypothetical protein [Yersinia enterocolitica]
MLSKEQLEKIANPVQADIGGTQSPIVTQMAIELLSLREISDDLKKPDPLVRELRRLLEVSESDVSYLGRQLAELKALEPFKYAVVGGDGEDVGTTKSLSDAEYMAIRYGGNVVPLFTASKPEEVNNFADIKCYSCSRLITIHQHAEADGFCPYCDAEIDLDGKEAGISNEFLTAAKPAEDKC